MIKKHILTLSLILATVLGFAQTPYKLNYPDITVGNKPDGGKIVLNGSNLQMPRIGDGSSTDSVLTIVNGIIKKVPRSQFSGGVGSYTAGYGMSLVGQQFSVKNILDFGGSSNGSTSNDAALSSIKTNLGKYQKIHFPNNQNGNAVYYFNSVPDLNNYTISADDSVTFSFPTTNSSVFNKGKLLNNVRVTSRDRDNTGVFIKNIENSTINIPISGLDKDEAISFLQSLNGNTFFKRKYDVTSDAFTDGSSSPTTEPQIQWTNASITASSAADSLNFDVATQNAIVEREYSASISTTSNAAGGMGGALVGASGEWVFFGLTSTGYKLISKKIGLPFTSVYIVNKISDAYVFNSSSNPEVSVRLLNDNVAEFYVNGYKVYSYSLSGTINTVGFGFNRSINITGIQYARNFSAYKIKSRVSGGVIRLAIFGDSISYGEGVNITYGDQIRNALIGRNGISDVIITNYAVSGQGVDGQRAKLYDTNVSGFDYVLVLIGTNDIIQQKNLGDFRTGITDMFIKILSDGSKPVFGTPPMYINRAATGYGFDAPNFTRGGDYRTAVKQITANYGGILADVNTFFGEISGTNKQLRDNLHPNTFFESAIARCFATAILADKQKSFVDVSTSDIAAGRTIGANILGTSEKWRGQTYEGQVNQNPNFVMTSDGINWQYNPMSDIKTRVMPNLSEVMAKGNVSPWDAYIGDILQLGSNITFRKFASNEFRLGDASAWRMSFLDGNVGIGNTSPGYKLDVSGNIYSSGNIYAATNDQNANAAVRNTDIGYNGGNISISGNIKNTPLSGSGDRPVFADADGTLKIGTSSSYTLPIASSTVLGGIKVGSGLAIDGDGVLSSTGSAGSYMDLTTNQTAAGNKTFIGFTTLNSASTNAFSLRNNGSISTPTGGDVNVIASAGKTVIASPTGTIGLITPTSGTLRNVTFPNKDITVAAAEDYPIVQSGTGSLTIPSGSNITRVGAHALTLTSTATTNATFPTGTYTLASTTNVSNAIKDTNLNITANQTLAASTWGTSGELTIFANASSGAITITLPTPANMQQLTVNVFKTDSSANVVTVSGSANINGSTTYTVTTQYSSVEIKSNGTQYYAK